ncbi:MULTISPECIES: type III secretion system needle length determinant [unclassified Vibrio]|uniref:type III secretion system needle length determinant n=1 Tax=unclassified Vibrio TaxID=2614977 RepID=UPI00292F91AD|nr:MULTISPECIES: type III secretion system needle length determinant [unclassified Vibrio]
MRITPTEETPNTLYKSTPEKKPLEREVELQSQFERAMTEKPSKGKESIVANPQKNHSGEEDLPLRHKTSQGLDKKPNLSHQEANADKNIPTLIAKSDVVTKRDVEKSQDDAANREEIICENNKLLKHDGKHEGDSVLSFPSTKRVDPHFQAQTYLKNDKPTPMDKRTSPDYLSTLESGLLPQSATEKELAQDAINIVGLTKKQTETAHNKRATQPLQNTGKRPDQTDGLPETKPLEKIETKVPSQPFASAATQGDVTLKSFAPHSQAHLKDDKPTPMDKRTSPNCLPKLEFGLLPQSATEKELAQDAINNANFTTKQTETTHNKRATQRLQDTGKLTDKTDSRSETKSLEKIETKSATLSGKADDEKAEPQHLASAATQGDVILKSVASQAQPAPVREVNTLLQQLVDKIYVSLPTASDNKEVRLFLSEGQLKGGEIHIKLDAQGYSVTIRQEHALSIISQQARQDLAERLNRFGGDQPLRLAISEQTQQLDQQQHEQQHSRQKRSVYEEWQAENDL